jgi:hypothetical protein
MAMFVSFWLDMWMFSPAVICCVFGVALRMPAGLENAITGSPYPATSAFCPVPPLWL